jgi:hypothetical protein
MKLLIALLLAFCLSKANGLLNLNDKKFSSTLLYKCPVQPDPMYPDKIDPSIIVFKNKTIDDLLKYESIILSTKSNILHEISYSSNINNYTFLYTSMASLDHLLSYANITEIDNETAIIQNDVTLLNEDSIDNDKYSQLVALSKDLSAQAGSRTIEIKNSAMVGGQIYKSIGRQLSEQALMAYLNPGSTRNITSSTVFNTSYIIVNANGYLNYEYFSPNDVIFGKESFGYLETVINADEITTSYDNKKKLIIETKLAECYTNMGDKINNIFNSRKLNMSLSELECSADFNSTLYLMNLNLSSIYLYSKYELINKLIPARRSSSFGLKLLSKAKFGTFVVFEGISLNQLTKLKGYVRFDYMKNLNLVYEKTLAYDAVYKGI